MDDCLDIFVIHWPCLVYESTHCFIRVLRNIFFSKTYPKVGYGRVDFWIYPGRFYPGGFYLGGFYPGRFYLGRLVDKSG